MAELLPIPHMSAPGLAAAAPHMRHGFFGRAGGVSEGRFASLNGAQGSGDEAGNVMRNRAMIAGQLAQGCSHLLICRQIHGRTALVVPESFAPGSIPEADAMVTDRPHLALAILSADCAPILMCDPSAGVIAAIHAGWRGAFAGIVEACIEQMRSLGAGVENIRSAIGPCLSKVSFEVGPEFEEACMAVSAWAGPFFSPGRKDRRHFDFKGYLMSRLARAGIGKAEALDQDTLSGNDRFFSARASARKKETGYGCNVSAIMRLE